MGFNLTGTQVKNTYQKLAQISGSYLTNGTGSVITNLNVIASNATQAVNAYTASYALYAVSASYEIVQEVTSSYAQVAGFANSTQFSTIVGKPTGLVSGSGQIVIGNTSGLLQANRVDGTVANAAIAGTANAVPWSGITSKPAGLVSGSSQINVGSTTGTLNANRIVGAITASAIPWTGITGKPSGLVSGSSQVSFTSISNKPAGLVSGSAQITLSSTSGNLAGNRISSAVANATAAVTATSASYALTATSATTATTATSATNAEDVRVYVKNTSGAIISKGKVVRISGATGDNPEIALAQPTSDALSANAIGITAEQIAINGFGYVITSGRLVGVDTAAFTPGTNLYLGTNGTFVATPSTAPNHTVRLGQVLRQQLNNGSIYVKVDNGYELGELHDVLISSPSGSGDLLQFDGTVWRNAKSLTGNYTFGGNQTFNNITVNGTGSFAYIVSVTGSVKRIGDAFIELNTDSPSQRFGGLKVVDSGSLQTGSIMWDSEENHWIYEATAEGAYKAGGFLAGPRSTDIFNVQYPTVNKVLKGQGGDHVIDSSITDTGVKVDFSTNVIVTGSITASTGFIGSLTGNADTATSATSATTAVTASHAERADLALLANLATAATSASYVSNQENFALKNAINNFSAGQNITGNLTVTGSASQVFAAPAADTTSTLVTVTGNQFVNIAPFSTSTQAYTTSRSGFVNQTRAAQYRMAYAIENYNNSAYNSTTWGSGFYANGRGFTLDLIPTGSTNFNNKSSIILTQGGLSTTSIALNATTIGIGGNPSVTTTGISLGNASLASITGTAASGSFSGITNSRFNNVRVNGALNTNGAVSVGTTLGVTGATTLSSTLGVTGNTTLTGELIANNKTTFNDQVIGAVQTLTPSAGTATLDCSIGNFFTLTLTSGTDTVLSPTNITAGQTINVQIIQNSGTAGTISFPSSVKFAGGTDYVASTGLNAVDVLTLVSFDGTSLLATAVKNLS